MSSQAGIKNVFGFHLSPLQVPAVTIAGFSCPAREANHG
jgi:hypothetical protein